MELRTEIAIRNTTLGGRTSLVLQTTPGGNEDLRIKVGEAEMFVGYEDLPALIAALEAVVKIRIADIGRLH